MIAEEQGEQLRSVFWIGGATAAGKSTTADVLAARHGIAVYHFDRQAPFHIYRSIPEEQPHLIRFMGRTMDDRWVLRSPEDMIDELVAMWTEQFSMVINDLSDLVRHGPVVAEGAGFFPSLVHPLLTEKAQAIWLIPSPEFQRWVRDTRERTVADDPHISNPARAYKNLIARDQLLAERLRREAEKLNLLVMSVDAGTVASIPDCIEPHFASWLRSVS